MMDWSTMRPHEMFEALKTAPRNIAGPWVHPVGFNGRPDPSRFPPCRRSPDGSTVVWDRDGKVSVHAWATQVRGLIREPAGGWTVEFDSREEADRELRSWGWILVDEVDEPEPTQRMTAPPINP